MEAPSQRGRAHRRDGSHEHAGGFFHETSVLLQLPATHRLSSGLNLCRYCATSNGAETEAAWYGLERAMKTRARRRQLPPTVEPHLLPALHEAHARSSNRASWCVTPVPAVMIRDGCSTDGPVCDMGRHPPQRRRTAREHKTAARFRSVARTAAGCSAVPPEARGLGKRVE